MLNIYSYISGTRYIFVSTDFFFSKGVSSNAAHGPDGDFLLLEDPPYIAMEDVSSGVRGEQCNVFNTGSYSLRISQKNTKVIYY